MKVIDHIDAFDKPDYSVVTIGTFDGVHIGHQTILKRLVEDAKKNSGKSILITFWPHPRFILNK
ncbi:MAG: riboflavin biosynthesis protein RibF, partial [Ekhidna sp.]